MATLHSLELLIQEGGDVNVQDYMYGTTALMEAARDGQAECVELLIEAGADVNIQNKRGKTALILAAHKGYDKIV